MLSLNAKGICSVSWNLLQHSHVFKYRQVCNWPQINILWNNKKKHLLPLQTYPLHSLNFCKLHSGIENYNTTEMGVQKSIAALQARKRVSRKKTFGGGDLTDQKSGLVIAYSSAEEYDTRRLATALIKQGLYQILELPEEAEDVIHVNAKYKVEEEPRQIFFFGEGSVVFWNVPELEQKNVLRFLKPFEINPYDPELVSSEREHLDYLYSEKGAKFSKGRIYLKSEGANNYYMYTFSNGVALSVKLGVREATLDNFINSTEWISERMKKGKKISMSREELSKTRGELFALRHVISLSSDLLDTPDFYWDRQELENLYQQLCNHLHIAKRTRVMNERLSYCNELIYLVGNDMNDEKHVSLEWKIIILIMVEIMFECIHLVLYYLH